MKPEKFINLLVFLVATGMLVWGICGNAGWKLLGANLLTAVFFMFLYRKDDNHPGVFSFAVRYAALALAFANARIMTGIAHGNLLLLFVLAAVYCLIDACLPVLAGT